MKPKCLHEEGEILMDKRPWYRSDTFFTIICIVVPPIGYIVVLANKKRLKHKHWIGLLTVATITMAVWLLKFLPGQWGNIIFLTGAGIYGYHKLLEKLKNK